MDVKKMMMIGEGYYDQDDIINIYIILMNRKINKMDKEIFLVLLVEREFILFFIWIQYW
jgi:hypothetical protein